MAEHRADPNADVIVGSVPTLGRANSQRLLALDPSQFACLITDEAHHATAESYQTIYKHFGVDEHGTSKMLHLGVTATPNRADNRGLSTVYDEVSYSMGILEAIQQGWLANLRAYRVASGQSIDGVHTRAGDFDVAELSSATNNAQRNQLVVKHWLETCKGRSTLVFCCDIAHAQSMAADFRIHGIKAEAIWGDDNERAEKLVQLRSGAIDVLCNCAVLTEGYDDWHISAIVMARPTKSQLLFVQCIGRGTRIPEGIDNLLDAKDQGIVIPKTDCVILDVVDLTSRHSVVTIPQLFGMAQHMNMKGRTVTAALNHFNTVQQQHPDADLSQAPDLTKLNSYAVSVDIFTMKWANEILDCSDFQWRKNVDGHYTLYLKRGRVDVREDVLGKWSVTGKIEVVDDIDVGTLSVCLAKGQYADIGNAEFDEHDIASLPIAFEKAEQFVRKVVPDELTLIRREAPWHKEPATDAQLKLMRRLHIQIKPNLTKGECQIAISRFLKKK